MAELTGEQRAAVESRGKTIVSASAGSGKTFVMIEKLTQVIERGADLDEVLAVTFTKKAAAQMKEKLRASLVKKLEGAEEGIKRRLKTQISKISSADISTIHSFCARLLRTHFYAVGIDGGFDIMAADDPEAAELMDRAAENVFEQGYASGNAGFLHLVKRYSEGRSDNSLKKLLIKKYAEARNVAHYRNLLSKSGELYTDGGFNAVCAELASIANAEYSAILKELTEFKATFPKTAKEEVYAGIFGEMFRALKSSMEDMFSCEPFYVTDKPRDGNADREAGARFKELRDRLCARYNDMHKGLSDRDTERRLFLASGETVSAFCGLLIDFDGEYSRLKLDENKLDYNDLEHLTLALLEDGEIKKEINSKYRYVFVDEYQDVNPVQEEIISAFGGELFLVGDIKQAIYGFRGSKSLFFAEKYNSLKGEGNALRLSGNFRSAPGVLDFANSLFSVAMREKTCGFNYSENSLMTAAGAYPEGSGSADILIFGKDEKEENGAKDRGVYSVMEDSRPAPPSREGLAVLKLVEEELSKKRWDLQQNAYIDVQQGDICILVRKNAGGRAERIARTLREAGYSVSGTQEENICSMPEVKQLLDILSLIDNAEQDIPLATALLSPLGGLSEDEAARIRIAYKREGKLPYRVCCARYLNDFKDGISKKLNTFAQKFIKLRELSQILTAEELIDAVISGCGLEAFYCAGGGEKLKNILRLAEEGKNLTLPAFMARIKASGNRITASPAAPADSIKIMTMHAAKGLEFPIVIISDICASFKGAEDSLMPFDDKYGFAPKYYDTEKMLRRTTLLRKLVGLRAEREELKNELNLFYVACTRAMCRLHILASEKTAYSESDVLKAKCYAQTFDMDKFPCAELTPAAPSARGGEVEAEVPADSRLGEELAKRFMKPYAYAGSVDLPVKSSASQIIKNIREDEPYFAEHELYGEEKAPDGQTGAARGTAYHRFLELCDFSVKSPEGICGEIENFVRSGGLTVEQAGLLSAEQLSVILNMPVFAGLGGAEIYREREFLCRLKACEIFPTSAEDYVLVQGAIDMMAVEGGKVRIIDYKYSKKTDEELVHTYSGQLALYKRAVSAIMGTPAEDISTAIVNLYLCRQIVLSP